MQEHVDKRARKETQPLRVISSNPNLNQQNKTFSPPDPRPTYSFSLGLYTIVNWDKRERALILGRKQVGSRFRLQRKKTFHNSSKMACWRFKFHYQRSLLIKGKPSRRIWLIPSPYKLATRRRSFWATVLGRYQNPRAKWPSKATGLPLEKSAKGKTAIIFREMLRAEFPSQGLKASRNLNKLRRFNNPLLNTNDSKP